MKPPVQPAGRRVPAGPRDAAPAQAGRPGASSAPAAQRADPGRPVVPAVHAGRRHRHDGRRPRRRLPAARPGQDVRVAVAVAAASTAAAEPLRRDAPRLPRGAAGAVQQGEVGDGAVAGPTTTCPAMADIAADSAPPRGEVAALVAVQSALADRPGALAGGAGPVVFRRAQHRLVGGVGDRRDPAAGAAPRPGWWPAPGPSPRTPPRC